MARQTSSHPADPAAVRFRIATEVTANSKAAIAGALSEARACTLELIEPLDDEQLNTVYSPILSPLAWDLGHIANFEELWLVQRIGDREPLHGDLGRLYDAIENPRRTRGELPILRDAELRAYMAEVRERTLEVLDSVDVSPGAGDPLLREGFVYEMLLAHEHQHNETMLQLLQIVAGYEPLRTSLVVEDASGQQATFTLQKRPGRIEVRSPVAGRASVKGRDLGAVPGVISLPAGRHELVVTAPRYQPYSAPVRTRSQSFSLISAAMCTPGITKLRVVNSSSSNSLFGSVASKPTRRVP